MSDERVLSVTLLSDDADFQYQVGCIVAGMPFAALGDPVDVPTATSEADFWSALESSAPGCVIVDLDSASTDGLRLVSEIVERNPATRVIASSREVSTERVLQTIRSGATEFLPKPVDDGLLTDALLRIRRLFASRDEAPPKNLGRVVTFFSVKGGSGVSTIACNTAVTLARQKQKSILLVALNLRFGELALFLGLQPRWTVLDLVANLHRVDEALLQTLVTRHDSGVHLLAAPDGLEVRHAVPGDEIRRALRFLRGHYDVLVLDLPNNDYDYLVAILDQVTDLFLVCTPDLPSLKNIQRTADALTALSFPGERLHVVVNRHHRNDFGVGLQAVERMVGGKLSGTIPNDYPAVIRAINSGIPVVTTNHSALARSFGDLAARILGDAAGDAPANGSRPRFAFLARK